MAHALWQSIPFASILLPLGSAAVTSVLKDKIARRWTTLVMLIITGLSAALVVNIAAFGQSYTYTMGHYTAPWGNEIRAGLLEAVTALFFSLIMLLSLLGGTWKLDSHLVAGKQNLYCVMLLVMQASLMAQVYTNDAFTAYVFVEIMTLSAAAMIASRDKGSTLVSSMRYLIMNSLGSGLFLLGIVLLYDLTGHLLMSNIQEAVAVLAASGEYHLPLTVVVALVTTGLAIKSALFPFHTWVPDAYGHSTPTSAAVLSSLVSKGYIFLLIKFFYRVFGLDVIVSTGVHHVLFLFALAAMVIGSVAAIGQKDIRRMVAWSSVAQIGYVYLGIGMGNDFGMMCAIFHMFVHSACKSLLFLAVPALITASDGHTDFHALRGSARRSQLAGAAFIVGALGMVGFPFLGGFSSKLLLAAAGLQHQGKHMILVLLVLMISTFLNTLYFLRSTITICRTPADGMTYQHAHPRTGVCFVVAISCLILLNVALGVVSQPVVRALLSGLNMFG